MSTLVDPGFLQGCSSARNGQVSRSDVRSGRTNGGNSGDVPGWTSIHVDFCPERLSLSGRNGTHAHTPRAPNFVLAAPGDEIESHSVLA